MNGRHARKLRKLSEFNPRTKRYYFCTNNANNFALSNSGELERVGGTIVEANKDKSLVTPRSIYKYMKEKYYDRTF